MRVDWWSKARADVIEIAETIQIDNPAAARSLVGKIEKRVGELVDFSHLGRIGRQSKSRELVIPSTPYIIVYRVHPDRIVVMRVMHAKRSWPPHRRR